MTQTRGHKNVLCRAAARTARCVLVACFAFGIAMAPPSRPAMALPDPSALIDPGCTDCFCVLIQHGKTLLQESQEILARTMTHFGIAMPVVEFDYLATKAGVGAGTDGFGSTVKSLTKKLQPLGDAVGSAMDTISSISDLFSWVPGFQGFPKTGSYKWDEALDGMKDAAGEAKAGSDTTKDMANGVKTELTEAEKKALLMQQRAANWFGGGPIAPAPVIGGRIGEYETWMVNSLYVNYIMPVFKDMMQQMTNTAMVHTAIIGTFFDAKNVMESRLLLEKMATEAYRDYNPSQGMCVIGTAARSMAAADASGLATRTALGRRALQRELSSKNAVGWSGATNDRAARLNQFARLYCDPLDNNGVPDNYLQGLGIICRASVTAKTVNRDIDYAHTFLMPRTLNLDFSNGGPPVIDPDKSDPKVSKFTDENIDEEAVLSLANNLYGHQIMDPLSYTEAGGNNDAQRAESNQAIYLNMRSVTAKRSVAENSFNAIAGLKTQGSVMAADAASYMKVVLRELGNEEGGAFETDMTKLLGARPSYMAQLEFLAKKIYQQPEFYTGLYESTANVKRRSVAMQAINLMLDRDIYNSQLRSESIMSILLETRLMESQTEVQNRIEKVPTR